MVSSKNIIKPLFSVFLVIATLFMCVGYASINLITSEINGEVIVQSQNGIFISNINYIANGEEETQKINYYVATIMDTEIVLDKNINSTVTYEVTVHNNSSLNYVFIGDIVDINNKNIYSNQNITYILDNIIPYETTILPDETYTFTITFKYNENDTSNNTLKSKINFRFKEIPILEVDNNTINIENIYPDYIPQEYKFKVSNYNIQSQNNVPLTYNFETEVPKPFIAKIYDTSGNEITGNININENNQDIIEHEYILKILWDNTNPENNIIYNSSEYIGKNFECKVNINTKPLNDEYLDYSLTKSINVNIETASLNFSINTESNIVMEKLYATMPIIINNYNDSNEYNSYDIDYEISISGNEKFTSTIDSKTNDVFNRTLQGNKIANDTFDILFNADIYNLLETENITLTFKIIKPYVKEVTVPVTINLQKLDVKFNANGGTVNTMSLTTYKGMNYGILPTPTWTGHTFDGWFTSSTGGTQITETTEVTLGNSTQTLYAHWTSRLLSDKVKPGELVNYDVGYSNITITYSSSNISPVSGYTGWKVLDVVGTGDDKYVLLITSGIPLSFVCPRLTTDTTNGQKCETALTTNFFSTSINSTQTNYKFYRNGFTGVSTIANLKTVFLNNKYTKLDSNGNPIVRAPTKSDLDGSLAMTAEINNTTPIVIANVVDFRNNTLFAIPSTSTNESYKYVPWYIGTKNASYYLWASYMSGYIVYTAANDALGVRPVVALKATTETTGQLNGVWQLSAVSE